MQLGGGILPLLCHSLPGPHKLKLYFCYVARTYTEHLLCLGATGARVPEGAMVHRTARGPQGQHDLFTAVVAAAGNYVDRLCCVCGLRPIAAAAAAAAAAD